MFLLYIGGERPASPRDHSPHNDAQVLDGAEVAVAGDQWNSMMPHYCGDPKIIGRNGSAGGF
jgi:hypothetical protein